MGGVPFLVVPAAIVRWLRTDGYTAFVLFTCPNDLASRKTSNGPEPENLDHLGVEETTESAVL